MSGRLAVLVLAILAAIAAIASIAGAREVAVFLVLAAAAVALGVAWDERRARDSRRRNRR